MGFLRILNQESLGEKEQALRIERLQGNFTWLAIIFVLILLQLPLAADVPKKVAYILIFVVAAFTFFWYHLLPKRFCGQAKNVIYTVFSIILVSFLVNWTGGVESFAFFLYPLIALSVAISMNLFLFCLFLFLIALSILFQAFLIFATANFISGLSVSLIHIWGVLMIALYGRMLSSQLALAKIEEKKAEIGKAEAIDRLQDEFVFFVSHKLQLPISSLSDYLSRMSTSATTKKIKEISGQLWQASLKLSRLVALFLDVAKIESGRLTMNIAKVDLPQIIKTVIGNFKPQAVTRSIKVNYKGPDSLYAEADQDRISEVLTNLIDNAIKFSREGQVVDFALESKDGKAIVSVADQAGGIPEEARKHIFEKYYRVKEGGKVAGTGLGLYISKKLIEKQNGKIWFEIREGEGTTFSFSLPVIKR